MFDYNPNDDSYDDVKREARLPVNILRLFGPSIWIQQSYIAGGNKQDGSTYAGEQSCLSKINMSEPRSLFGRKVHRLQIFLNFYMLYNNLLHSHRNKRNKTHTNDLFSDF